MRLIKGAALAAVAKKVYDEAKKPENQAKLKEAAAKVRAEVEKRRRAR